MALLKSIRSDITFPSLSGFVKPLTYYLLTIRTTGRAVERFYLFAICM